MEKKNYYTPEAKFHQLKTSAMIADSEPIGGGNGNGDMEAKGFSSISFDEDED